MRKGDNLYSCSVVALDPDSGKLKWHYQFTPNDTHDWDATEDVVLVDRMWHGQNRKLLMQANRNGIFYVLDRVTGSRAMGQARASFPRFRRAGVAPRIELTDDDVELLRRVYRYRFIRADDLYRLFDQRSADKLSRRLVRLYRNHYLDRPIAQVDRYREGGSKSLVYGLDNAGARFIAGTLGYSVTSGDWKARNRTYTRENLDHTLSMTRFLVDLELACRRRTKA